MELFSIRIQRTFQLVSTVGINLYPYLDKSMIWNVSILKMSSHTLIEGKAHLSAY